MLQLLEFPPEILLRIINKVHPDDLDNFCRCCRGLERFSEKALQRHESMKRQYSSISCGAVVTDDGTVCCGEHPIKILQAIVEDPHYAFYPRTIRIGNYNGDVSENMNPGIMLEMLSIMEQLGDNSTGLFSAMSYLEDQKDVDRWKESVEGADGGSCAALAISLLPNLESITLTDYADNEEQLSEMLDGIIKTSLESPPLRNLPLSKLSKVRISPLDEAWQEPALLGLFAQLPSMRQIYAEGIDAEGIDGGNELWKITPHVSRITELVFEQSVVSASIFLSLFSGLKALQKFKYEAVYRDHDLAYWKPRKMIGALLKHTKYSLEELDVTFCDRDVGFVDFYGDDYMGSLTGFKNLKHIRVNCEMFFMVDIKLVTEVSPIISQVFVNDDEDMPGPLVMLLPRSIETIIIVGAFLDQATTLFSGLSKLRETHLPKLKVITFENSRAFPVTETVKACCKECGITLNCS